MSEYRSTSSTTRKLLDQFEALRDEHRRAEEALREVKGDALAEDELEDMQREHGELEDAAAAAVREQRNAERAVRDQHGAELTAVLGDVVVESYASIARFGDQSEVPSFTDNMDAFRMPCAAELRAINASDPSWETILLEEVVEAGDEADVESEEQLERELVQIASVACKWVAVLRSRRRARGES